MPDVYGLLSRLLGGGDPEAQGAAQASTAMQPQVLDYAQRVLSGQIAREGVLGQPRPYDPALSYRENVPDLRASLEPSIDVAMGIGPGVIRAFHGSPFNFSRFDMSKIGTGEGAQAYGHGLYFAENEGVARGYRDTLAGKVPLKEYQGHPLETNRDWYSLIDKTEAEDWRLAKIIDAAGKQGGVRAALDTFEPYTRNASDGPLWAAAVQKFRTGVGPAAKGHMYEVDINADPQRLLDWDKPLGAQPAELQQAMSRVLGPGSHAQDRGQTLYDMISNAYDKRFFTGGRAEASQALADAGIPGVRYLDQGSRGAGQGTSNYAIFNDKLIDILRKYGIAGPVVGAGALAAAGSEPPT